MTDRDPQREAFEAWAVSHGFKVQLRNDHGSQDTYSSYETEQRWIVWQEATRHASAREAANIPQTPEEIVAFVGGHYDAMEDAPNLEDVRFSLSVHDLQSAMYWWFVDVIEAAAPEEKEG